MLAAGGAATALIISRLLEFVQALPCGSCLFAPSGWNGLARQYLLVLDRPLDSLNRVLDVDEARASPGRLPLPSKFCVELVERPSQVGNGSANRSAFQADVFMALLDLPNMVLDVLGHAAEIALYLIYVRRYSIAFGH